MSNLARLTHWSAHGISEISGDVMRSQSSNVIFVRIFEGSLCGTYSMSYNQARSFAECLTAQCDAADAEQVRS